MDGTERVRINGDFITEQYRLKVDELTHENLMLKAYIKQLEAIAKSKEQDDVDNEV